MAASTQAEQRSPDADNPVSSFEVGIMTVRGSWVGICIKFSMYDKATKITHWSPHAYSLLIEALDQYYQHLGANAFMFRAKADPSRTRTDPLVGLVPVNAGTTPEIGRGTGLGLAIVSQIIEAHNGTITAANHPELGGGWLRLRLPATRSE